MNAYIQHKAINQLTLDARKQPTTTEVELHIIDKQDPDSWFMTYNDMVFDSIAVKTWQNNYATLLITIKSADKDLRFAEPESCNARQAFAGLLFISGNHTMLEFRALTSETKEHNQLSVVVNPSPFWAPKRSEDCMKIDGNKIGFRFVVVDKDNKYFFSHDPIFSGPDWDHL